MSRFNFFINEQELSVDVDLLRAQRNELLDVAQLRDPNRKEPGVLDGLIALLDAMLDAIEGFDVH